MTTTELPSHARPRPGPSQAGPARRHASPDVMAVIEPIMGDVLRAGVKHYREQGQDEIRRGQLVAMRRFFAQAVNYAGKPEDVADPFGDIGL
jgi:hypothetical protein